MNILTHSSKRYKQIKHVVIWAGNSNVIHLILKQASKIFESHLEDIYLPRDCYGASGD